jgi:hypothetical protein
MVGEGVHVSGYNIIHPANYNGHAGITKSAICAARIDGDTLSMAHMHAAMTADRDDDSDASAAMRWGTLAHAALLEPATLAARVAVWDGAKRGSEYLTFKADVQARGLEIVTRGELDKLTAMNAAIRADKDARWIVGQCDRTEVGIEWTDGDYGLAKGRLDGCGAGMLLEYKTCRSISRRAFLNAGFTMGYHIGAAWYWHGYGRPEAVYILAQQSTAPYTVCSYVVPHTVLALAYEESREIAMRYRMAERAGVFSGPYSGLQTYELPAWATGNDEVNMEGITEQEAT